MFHHRQCIFPQTRTNPLISRQSHQSSCGSLCTTPSKYKRTNSLLWPRISFYLVKDFVEFFLSESQISLVAVFVVVKKTQMVTFPLGHAF